MANPRVLNIDGITVGQDVTLSFDGETSPSAWTLAGYVSQDGSTPGSATVTKPGGNEIRVFIPSTYTEDLTASEDSPLILEVWREDANDTYPVITASIPVYSTIRVV